MGAKIDRAGRRGRVHWVAGVGSERRTGKMAVSREALTIESRLRGSDYLMDENRKPNAQTIEDGKASTFRRKTERKKKLKKDGKLFTFPTRDFI